MKRFAMSPEQLERLYAASRPVMCIVGTWPGPVPPSPQENANRFWQQLGDEMGFAWETARPIAGEPDSIFEAEETLLHAVRSRDGVPPDEPARVVTLMKCGGDGCWACAAGEPQSVLATKDEWEAAVRKLGSNPVDV